MQAPKSWVVRGRAGSAGTPRVGGVPAEGYFAAFSAALTASGQPLSAER